MKKITEILLTFLFLCGIANAEDEMIFNNVQWLSNVDAVMQGLYDAGLAREKEINLTHEEPVYFVVSDSFISPDRVNGLDDVAFVADLHDSIKGKIAGYPIKDLKLTFAYDGEYRLIATRVELINAPYDEIKNKLIKVYGEAETYETEDGIWSNVWNGENNTAIILYTQSEGLDYTFMYGRLDAVDILTQCAIPDDPDDVSGL